MKPLLLDSSKELSASKLRLDHDMCGNGTDDLCPVLGTDAVDGWDEGVRGGEEH